MEKDFSRGQLEELLKERTEEYKMYPTERVWSAIYHRLHTRRKWHFIGWSTFALMATAGVFLLMQDNTSPAAKITKITTLSAKNTPRADEAAENYTVSPGTLSLNNPASRPGGRFLASRLDPTLTPIGQYAGNGNISPDENNALSERNVPNTNNNTDNTADGGTTADDQTQQLHTIENSPLLTSGLSAKIANASALAAAQKALIPSKPASRFGWLFHFEPSVSFRTLKSKAAIKAAYGVGMIVVNNNSYDINQLVEQRPSVGLEIGTDFFYALTSRLSLKAGLQFNYSRYTAQAYNTGTPQPATVALGGAGTGGIPPTTVQSYSQYVNAPGPHNVSETWIPDQRAEISLPVGAEFKLLHNQNISWNVAGSFQPSYILNAKAFLLSQNYENYVEEPNLLRRWNMNVAAETFVRINKGKVQLQIGPQVRYQLQPSFISSYPVKEHLYDIGFKIGITQNIR